MDKTKVNKYEYVECKFKGHCFMCQHRTNKVAKELATPMYICSDRCYKDYEEFVKEQSRIK